MSSIGNWAYVDDIYLKKYLGYIQESGEYEWADPIMIKGYYSSVNEAVTDAQGIEFIPNYTVMTEYEGITTYDLISYDGVEYQKIRRVDFYN